MMYANIFLYFSFLCTIFLFFIATEKKIEMYPVLSYPLFNDKANQVLVINIFHKPCFLSKINHKKIEDAFLLIVLFQYYKIKNLWYVDGS